ncbi:hypothetical protein LMG27952_05839 [Paraburkholderia hiiakae]|uniref:DUF937 domain-containing protein n=1 Tax=Paraburkholderia hiiakae TaxID=1081782 RepID=A0ABN7I7G3_9BURK|nr:hypothetical protein [Paraburkholderia hiiakae]CAD6555550.1 hypothetical protein LMG27952_05839 [Paraburkholderia hiiakae]
MNTLYGYTNQPGGQYGEAEASEATAPFAELNEMELASEALEVANEAELEQFLGDVVSSAAKSIGGFLSSDTGKALVSSIKPIAKQALPIIGSAIGGRLGGPEGAQIGATLLPAVGQAFGLELEGLSNEDREFELARRLVRFAGSAGQEAANAFGTADDRSIAHGALMRAAQRFAPGLAGGFAQSNCPHCGQSLGHGHRHRWVRRGNTIVVLNAGVRY